jgi:hypothetical protein
MEAQKVDVYIMSNANYFESHQVSVIRERLMVIDDSKWITIQTIPLKDPQTSLIVSLLGMKSHTLNCTI